MRKNLTYLFLLISFATFFISCDNTDDVDGIFTKDTWKLTEIFDNNGKPIEIWNGDAEAKQKSYTLKDTKGNFVLNFTGLPDGDNITGTFSGTVAVSTISGNWNANGKKNTVAMAVEQKNNAETDVYAVKYINVLNYVYQYKGDYNTLRLYYRNDNTGEAGYLLMRSGE